MATHLGCQRSNPGVLVAYELNVRCFVLRRLARLLGGDGRHPVRDREVDSRPLQVVAPEQRQPVVLLRPRAPETT